jgi:hypothetical protein
LEIERSISVTGTGSPPEAETRWICVSDRGAKTMTPSRFQLPPLPFSASQMVIGGPPAVSIFFRV